MEEDKLSLLIPNYERQKLNIGNNDELFFLDWVIEFKQDKNSNFSGFLLNTGRVAGIEFKKKDK